MHFTFRCKVDAGTPADRIEGAHVYVEVETLDDLESAVNDVALAYAKAIDQGTGTAFLDEVVMRDLYPDGEDRPGDDPAPHVTEAVANLRMALDHVEAASDRGSWISDVDTSLQQAQADIAQAIGFLTGEETPA
jgi:hypothetical protein